MHSVLEIIEETPDSAGPDLVALDNLKFALGISGTDEDAALQAAITFQSKIIAEYCDRRFGLRRGDETFTFDPGETLRTRNALTLSLYPVVDVLDVTDVADFEFDPPSGRLWTEGLLGRRLAVNYVGGYDLPEGAPARLSKAVVEAVNDSRMAIARDPLIREIQHGETHIGYFSSRAVSSAGAGYLSEVVLDLIKPFRRLHSA